MTEEEKTLFMDWKIKNKDNIENVVITLLNYEIGVGTKTCYDEVDYLIRKAFFAGLKAGRPQWHKVADGDLPKEGVQVLSDQGTLVIYSCFCWFEYSPNADNIKFRNWEKPIAWCEVPKYTEA